MYALKKVWLGHSMLSISVIGCRDDTLAILVILLDTKQSTLGCQPQLSLSLLSVLVDSWVHVLDCQLYRLLTHTA